MAVVWADVVLVASDLSAVSSGAQTAILADVAARLSNADAWPSTALYERAQVYLAAHLGTLERRKALGAGGPVASESVGSMSRSYAVRGQADEYDSTSWGQQFKGLRRLCLNRAGTIA